ncbi:hypothetical protein LINPERHAP1_LOCUS55 [Linum perenne]
MASRLVLFSDCSSQKFQSHSGGRRNNVSQQRRRDVCLCQLSSCLECSMFVDLERKLTMGILCSSDTILQNRRLIILGPNTKMTPAIQLI